MDRDQLAKRLRAGEKDALAPFLDQTRPQLLAYITGRMSDALRSKLEPEDVAQEVNVAALGTFGRFELGDRDPFGWLCQLAERRIIDAHRRFFGAQKRAGWREIPFGPTRDDTQRAEVIDLLVASMTTASQAFSRNERGHLLLEALARLPQQQRDALRLRYVDGLASKEIADRLGKSDGAVRVMLTRSLKLLQELLGPQAAP